MKVTVTHSNVATKIESVTLTLSPDEAEYIQALIGAGTDDFGDPLYNALRDAGVATGYLNKFQVTSLNDDNPSLKVILKRR